MKTWSLLLLTTLIVVLSSIASVDLWGEKEEVIAEDIQVSLSAAMSVDQFAEVNKISGPALKTLFNLSSQDQRQQPITEFGMSLEEISIKANKLHALDVEDATKNWFKIPLKFATWAIFLILCFVLLLKKKLNKKVRMSLYGLSVVLFGVILGADPSPMGTVKDALVLYGSKGVIFKPRLVAFLVFSLTVVLANKFICSWGCQFGTLQDFIFRLNRNTRDSAQGSLPQYKIPFLISNSIRILFFIALILVAFTWATDLTHEIDPFKIYKPLNMTLIGIIFMAVLLISSLFVYRPWCHLFCPFGLSGWLFEKLSIFKIKVDYDKCISCESCVSACPSPVMGAILKQDKMTIPDCFSCGNCIEVCPTAAISLAVGKREAPPAGKFDKNQID
jgi:NAD-dependent dihydropyrimidine dehydrogenase PreA subunit